MKDCAALDSLLPVPHLVGLLIAAIVVDVDVAVVIVVVIVVVE